MFKVNFRDFDFRGFIDFIFELVDKHGFFGIRFYPEHKERFSEGQLTHAAPRRNINDPGGFVWAWRKSQDVVRKVSFDFSNREGEKEIFMTIDLNNKSISLDNGKGISSIEIEDVLRRTMDCIVDDSKIENTGKTIGIINEGNNTSIIDCDFETDVGIINRGERMNSMGNRFANKSDQDRNISKIEIVNGNKIEQYGNKNSTKIRNNEQEGFGKRFFWNFIVALGVLIIGGLILYKVFGIK